VLLFFDSSLTLRFRGEPRIRCELTHWRMHPWRRFKNYTVVSEQWAGDAERIENVPQDSADSLDCLYVTNTAFFPCPVGRRLTHAFFVRPPFHQLLHARTATEVAEKIRSQWRTRHFYVQNIAAAWNRKWVNEGKIITYRPNCSEDIRLPKHALESFCFRLF